jgi:outer membrane beta-barrel protein
VHHLGGSIGYHFNQYFSLHGIAWRAAAVGSDALATFESTTGHPTVDTNMPSGFYGVQANYNFLYGKASLIGKVIIYVDLFVLGGMGVTSTESGNNITPFIGLGQKIHLSKWLSLNLDYRIMRYNETIKYKSAGPGHVKGDVRGERANTTDAVTLGLSFFY